jgi:hypothetical protein
MGGVSFQDLKLVFELQCGRGVFGLVEVARYGYLEMDGVGKARMCCVGEGIGDAGL